MESAQVDSILKELFLINSVEISQKSALTAEEYYLLLSTDEVSRAVERVCFKLKVIGPDMITNNIGG